MYIRGLENSRDRKYLATPKTRPNASPAGQNYRGRCAPAHRSQIDRWLTPNADRPVARPQLSAPTLTVSPLAPLETPSLSALLSKPIPKNPLF